MKVASVTLSVVRLNTQNRATSSSGRGVSSFPGVRMADPVYPCHTHRVPFAEVASLFPEPDRSGISADETGWRSFAIPPTGCTLAEMAADIAQSEREYTRLERHALDCTADPCPVCGRDSRRGEVA